MFGQYQPIPDVKLDYLIAGTSCVDFSTLNITRGKDKNKVTLQESQAPKKSSGGQKLPPGFDDNYSADVLLGKVASPVAVDPIFSELLSDFVDSLEKVLHAGKNIRTELNAGESTVTFCSTLNFMMHRRPRVAIFENVSSAPFDQMAHFWLARTGYYAEFASVDSNKYYLPQSRNRKYLIAVDVQEFEDLGLDARELVHAAKERLRLLERRASAPVTDFFLADDDARFRQARAEMEASKAKTANRVASLWVRQQTRHAIYRGTRGLDEKYRLFSQALTIKGKLLQATPPSRSWITYLQNQPMRVIDLLDAKVQEQLTVTEKTEHCDIRYKDFIFDISQSIDRHPFRPSRIGAAPIVTPSGEFVFMFSGRPITGIECLTFQGIPTDQLYIANETQAQLRDLAGNAMSVTVIGAAFLAAHSTIHSALLQIHEALGEPTELDTTFTADDVKLSDAHLETDPAWSVNHAFQLVDWTVLNQLIDLTSIRCHCQLIGSENPHLYQCQHCGKHVCARCKGNPPHNLKKRDHQPTRIDPFSVKTQLLNMLPGFFQMGWPAISEDATAFDVIDRLNHIPSAAVNSYGPALLNLLAKDFYYRQSVTVSMTCIIIEYQSTTTMARLVLRKDERAWYLYPRRPERGPARFADLVNYSEPIARGIVDDEKQSINPSTCCWFFWEPVDHHFNVALSNIISMPHPKSFTIQRSDIHPRSGEQHQNEEVTNHILDTITGSYKHLPHCGTAEDELHAKTRTCDEEKPLFFFRDVRPTRKPISEIDRWIFSHDIEVQDTQKYRGDEIYAEYAPDATTIKLYLRGYWIAGPKLAVNEGFESRVHDESFRNTGAAFSNPSQPTRCCDSPLPTDTLIQLRLDELMHVPLSQALQRMCNTVTDNTHWYLVDNIRLQAFLKQISFATPLIALGVWYQGETSEDGCHGVRVPLCEGCCIAPPPLYWIQKQPWEDPDEVKLYQEQRGQQPFPLIALVQNDVGRSEEFMADGISSLSVKLGVNSRTLASRAAAYLIYSDRPRAFSHAIKEKVKLSFRVEIGKLLAADVTLSKFYDMLPETVAPFGLHPEDVQTLTDELDVPDFKSFKLRPDQARSVRWMMSREKNPAPF